MKNNKSEMGIMFWGFLFLISSNLMIIPLVSATNNNNLEDNKTYYSPPSHTPSGHHHHRHVSPTPSSSGSHVNCGDPTPSPPHVSCGCPTPPTPSGGHHGGYYPPSTPKTPLVPSPPPYNPPVTPTPDPPSGGYYGPPSTPTPTPLVPSPPIVPVTPTSPDPPSGGYYGPPSTPTPIITPAPPLVPGTPFTPVPFDPNSPPFPCTYWGSHPGLIFGVVGWWATVGGLFGVPSLPGLSLPGLSSPSDYSVTQLLNNPKKDPYTSLYREATASFLNSMASRNFPFTSTQVKNSLLGSLGSNKAAANQARLFRLANEGKLKLEADRDHRN